MSTQNPDATKENYAPGGPALLFENIKGHPGHKVLINQFGSERRMALALGVDRLDEIAERIQTLMNVKPPSGGFLDKLKMLPQLAELANVFPKTVSAKDAPCKEVIRRDNFDLNFFPSSSAGRTTAAASSRCPASTPATRARASATSACIACRSTTARPPACTGSGKRSPPSTIARHCVRQPPGRVMRPGRNLQESRRWPSRPAARSPFPIAGGLPQVALGNLKGSRLEVAVAIGTDPATTFSAIVPAPPEVEEFLIAGFLRGKPVEIVQCETVDLEVPAHAEIILEGYVELGELRAEGPFGDHTGFYTLTDEYPVFHLTCITHRRRPHLRRDHRRQAAHGRRMDGQGRRAHLPPRHAHDHP